MRLNKCSAWTSVVALISAAALMPQAAVAAQYVVDSVLDGLSAHADRDDLLAWAGRFEAPPGTVLVAHGEESVSLEFAATLSARLGWKAEVPFPGTPYPL